MIYLYEYDIFYIIGSIIHLYVHNSFFTERSHHFKVTLITYMIYHALSHDHRNFQKIVMFTALFYIICLALFNVDHFLSVISGNLTMVKQI